MSADASRPTLLILSFSDISSDARVLRQVRSFGDEYELVSCGFGDAPMPGVRHIEIPTRIGALRGRLRPYVDAALVRAKLYRRAYWSDPLVRAAKRALRGQRFDAVLANDIESVPLALGLAEPGRVHIDLHEFFPGLHDDVPAWNRIRKPYFEWLIRHYATRAASATTVGVGLAEAYTERYDLPCAVVTNASPRLDLAPTPIQTPIRLVHSGVALPGRQLELMMRAVGETRSDVILDLFLMPNDHVYLDELRTLAAAIGPRVRLRDPLPYSELVSTLNDYDLGVFVLPPTTFNNANALPNKFFDFVQARLGMVIGPSPEMARLLEAHDLGAVTADFSAEALTAVLDELQPERIGTWKRNADAAADELSEERQIAVWREALRGLFASWGGAVAGEPVVDVTIAVHTRTRPIARAVASVLTGNTTPLRVTVVAHNIDREIIDDNLGELVTDPRVRVLHLEDGIPSPAGPMNLGFASGATEFFAVMGSDDELAPGAIDSWVALARSSGAAAVLATIRHVDGPIEPSPPVRPGRSTDLDPVKDRLAYRSAPLGLLRRREFGELRLPVGLRSGEDLPFVTRVWFSGAAIAFDSHGPAYLVHADAGDRVTAAPRPIGLDFAFLDHIIGEAWADRLRPTARRAIAVKTIRIHVFDAILNRSSLAAWPDGERDEFAAIVQRLLDWGAQPERSLSMRERRALDAVLDSSVPDAELALRGRQRAAYLHPFALLPRNPLRVFGRQAPFRTLLAGWLLLRGSNRRRG